MGTRVEPRPEVETEVDDPSEFAHIVTKRDQMKGYIEGAVVTALCGYRWIPSRDPEDLPVCQVCADLKEKILSARRGLN